MDEVPDPDILDIVDSIDEPRGDGYQTEQDQGREEDKVDRPRQRRQDRSALNEENDLNGGDHRKAENHG